LTDEISNDIALMVKESRTEYSGASNYLRGLYFREDRRFHFNRATASNVARERKTNCGYFFTRTIMDIHSHFHIFRFLKNASHSPVSALLLGKALEEEKWI